MPRPRVFDFDLADASLTGFASNVTGAGPWTPTTTETSDGLAHQVSIKNDSATDHSGKTLTLTGTDANGDALTETLAAPGTSATVESVGYFKTLTSVAVSATIGSDTFDIGWVDEAASQVIPLNRLATTAAAVGIDITGTINYTVQETFDDIQNVDRADLSWFAVSALSGKTADLASSLTPNATGVRLLVNSYSSGAEARMTLSESDM